MPTRRSLLQLSGLSAVALSLGGLGLALRPGVTVAPPQPLRSLSPTQFSVLSAVADLLFPGGDGLPTAAEVDVAGFVDVQLAEGPPNIGAELGQALDLLENALAGMVLEGRTQPFTALSVDEQRATLESWSAGRFEIQRVVVRALSTLCSVGYWSSPLIYAGVGYGGPPPVPWPEPEANAPSDEAGAIDVSENQAPEIEESP